MMTGNLGALRVIVDGEAAPGLGPLGVIGRGIPLDADSLLDGQMAADFCRGIAASKPLDSSRGRGA